MPAELAQLNCQGPSPGPPRQSPKPTCQASGHARSGIAQGLPGQHLIKPRAHRKHHRQQKNSSPADRFPFRRKTAVELPGHHVGSTRKTQSAPRNASARGIDRASTGQRQAPFPVVSRTPEFEGASQFTRRIAQATPGLAALPDLLVGGPHTLSPATGFLAPLRPSGLLAGIGTPKTPPKKKATSLK